MNNYYFLTWKHTKEAASAFALKDFELDHELIPKLEGKTSLPFDFQLMKLTEGDNNLVKSSDLTGVEPIWLDYQPNDMAWPLMSERMMLIIMNHLTGQECIDWLSCIVKGADDQRTYYVLRFNKLLDVLDKDKTIYVNGTDHIIKPVFALSRILNYSIFPKPLSHGLWKFTSGLHINEALKKELKKQKITGIDFEKVSVS